jgi:hypothetical protein
VFLLWIVIALPVQGQRRKKHHQEVRLQSEEVAGEEVVSSESKSRGDSFASSSGAKDPLTSDFDVTSSCLPCIGVDRKGSYLQAALRFFWKKLYGNADNCLCHYFKTKQDDSLGKALSVSLQTTGGYRKATKPIQIPRDDFRPIIKNWEILGPINVGKLELDSDPTFLGFENWKMSNKDPARYILSLDDNQTIYSELMPDAKVSWKKYSSKSNGQVDVYYNLPWNDIAQGLSSTSVYEWQGWARTTTFVPVSGVYLIDCQGPHSLYLVNNDKTHLLTSDVYRAQQIRTSIELKTGIVGVVIPLRAVVQAQFIFTMQLSPDHAVVYSPLQVPHLLELENKRGFGMLVSGVFSLPIHNVFSIPITVNFAVDMPIDEEDVFYVREARRHDQDHNSIMPTTIAPGQTVAFPLELFAGDKSSIRNSHQRSKIELPTEVTFLRCAENNRRVFQLIVSASKGASVQVSLELECRRWDQSFHITYLNHDDSVGQAAVILPLDFHSPSHHRKLQMSMNSGSSSGQRRNIKKATDSKQSSDNAKLNMGDDFAHPNGENIDDYSGYPVLLTYHGSGIVAQNHADAYKMMPSYMKEYLFGVKGYYIISPSRFGAHNWEGVGEFSGREALFSLAHLINHHFSGYLPLVSLYNGIISGHSMGGHGAWVTAVNAPNHFACAVPTAGWIKKSEYSNSNDFFRLDGASSHTPPNLKRILEQALSEYHVDSLLPTLRTQDVHIRVGTHDMTTHAWYSRRMYRLLFAEQYRLQENSNRQWANISLEEVSGKQHWWWDTQQDNDGGVLNDPKMRLFYQSCHQQSSDNIIRIRKIQQYVQEQQDEIGGKAQLGLEDPSIHKLESDVNVDGTNTNIISASTTSSTGKNEALLKENAALFSQSAKSKAALLEARLQEFVSMKSSLPCHRNLSLTVINPAAQEGQCGVRVWQQSKSLELSQVDVSCEYHVTSQSSSTSALSRVTKSCTLRVHNVRRLAISLQSPHHLAHNVFHDTDILIIKAWHARLGVGSESVRWNLNELRESQKSLNFMHICFASHAISFPSQTSTTALPIAKICEEQIINPLQEKHLANYGPIRRVYDRVFYIVYGTPPNQALRDSMRSLAVYLANAHFVAHNSYVQVLSDLEFKTAHVSKRQMLPNIIFIGDTTSNKLLKSVVFSAASDSDNFEIRGILPGNITFDFRETKAPAVESAAADDDEYVDTLMPNKKSATSGGGIGTGGNNKEEKYSFTLHNRIFDRHNHAVAFTMPLQRATTDNNKLAFKPSSRLSKHRSLMSEENDANDNFNVAMGVVLHGNSVEAYSHLSRLAWPVIPPMVRAPFSLYLPDYVVLDPSIWDQGPGGLLAAGYWDSRWQHDHSQSHWRHV